jgi:formylglycine-generating enzyme required for sulfatase activity
MSAALEHTIETRAVDIGTGSSGKVTMTFCKIPACPEGFWMGSRDGASNEQPVHRVVIPHDIWLGQTPVTQEQFRIWTESADYERRMKRLCRTAMPHQNFHTGDRHPADRLTWRQAFSYCQWLGELLMRAAQFPSDAVLCRLPYEAEWEYACRAGTETDYHSGDGAAALSEVGWYDGNSDSTQEVGKLPGNRFGLHDMHGNVWEWCADRWDAGAYRRRWDGITAEETYWLNERHGDNDDKSEYGENRVLRGGSWFDSPDGCRAAFRNWFRAANSLWNCGFRVCLAPRSTWQGSERSSGT